MKPRSTIRTSLDIPVALHRRVHEAARRRGCSARQLILQSLEQIVAEEPPRRRLQLPIVPGTGVPLPPVTNDEALALLLP